MKKSKLLLLMVACVPLLFSACPLLDLLDPPKEEQSVQYFWGTWLQMDTGKSYDITDTHVGDARITAASDSSISFSGVTITKQTENVARIGSKGLLFRKGGANRSFTAKVSGFSDTTGRAAIGMGMQPLVGRKASRKNKNNTLDTETVTSDSSGILTFNNSVAGSTQNITVDTVTVAVAPEFDGEFIGSIPIVESGYSFKVTSSIKDKTNGYLYGQGYDSYEINVKITNIGDADCETSMYTIVSEDPNLTLNGHTSGNFNTLEPKSSNDLTIYAQYKTMNEAYVDASIKIIIKDSSLNPRTWEDYIVLRFHLKPITLAIKSQNNDATNKAKLNGFLMHPDGNSQRFTVGDGQTEYLTLPWSTESYKLAFTGADANSEMRYTFVVGSETLPSLVGVLTPQEINAFEPNESELYASKIEDCLIPVKSYLKKNDIDYFVIDVSKADSTYAPVVIDDYAHIDVGGNGDHKPNPNESMKMDVRLHNAGTRTVLGLTVVLTTTDPNITITNGSVAYGDVIQGYYQSIYYKADSLVPSKCSGTKQSYNAKISGNTPNAFAYTIAPTSIPGTDIPFTLTMTDSWGNEWVDTFNVTIVATGANMKFDDYAQIDVGGNGDYNPNPNESMKMDVRLHNAGTSTVLGLTVVLTTTDPNITITNGSVAYGDVIQGYYQSIYYKADSLVPSKCSGTKQSYNASISGNTPNAFAYTIAPTSIPGTDIPFTLTMTDSWGNEWVDTFNVTIVATGANMKFDDYAQIDVGGNGDHKPNPNESMKMDVRLHNAGTSKVLGLNAVLTTTDPNITITKGSFEYGQIETGYYQSIYKKADSWEPSKSVGTSLRNNTSISGNTPNAFAYTIASTCSPGTVIPFTLTMTDSWGNEWVDTFNVTVE